MSRSTETKGLTLKIGAANAVAVDEHGNETPIDMTTEKHRYFVARRMKQMLGMEE